MQELVVCNPHPAPTAGETRHIAAITDPVLRNLKITQAYHDLKIALTLLLGHENVSWCAYATWASKTAGRFIRGELLPDVAREILDRTPSFMNMGTAAALSSMLSRIGQEVSAHVAEGNFIVFEEMAPLYADWIARFSNARRRDRAELHAFVRQLRPGPAGRGGQDMLIDAFTYYYDAMFERDRKARAELILLANLLVGYHEQTRLQGPIERAMNVPLLEPSARNLIAGAAKSSGTGIVEHTVSLLFGRLWADIERRRRELLTRGFMTLKLPALTLDLGQDLPPWSMHHDFPFELRKTTHPRLIALLRELDRTPDTVMGSGARDWACLSDRMNFVVDFFRSRQQDGTLYDRPFSPLQTAAIAQNRIPCGAL